MHYWLVKSEPTAYSWNDLVKEGSTAWSGVRNFQARNNLRTMKVGDLILFYHSVKEKAVVGTAKVIKEYYPDPTTKETAWVVVDIVPVSAFSHSVSLESIKRDKRLEKMALIKQSRLSVCPVTEAEFTLITAKGMEG